MMRAPMSAPSPSLSWPGTVHSYPGGKTMAVMTGSVSASASGGLYDVWENTIRAKFSSLSARTRCIKQGQRAQWSSHQGTELELLSGAGSWSAAAASLSSLSSLSWSSSLSPLGEHGGDVSAGSPGSSGHSGGHLRLGALTGLHTQEVGCRMICDWPDTL